MERDDQTVADSLTKQGFRVVRDLPSRTVVDVTSAFSSVDSPTPVVMTVPASTRGHWVIVIGRGAEDRSLSIVTRLDSANVVVALHPKCRVRLGRTWPPDRAEVRSTGRALPLVYLPAGASVLELDGCCCRLRVAGTVWRLTVMHAPAISTAGGLSVEVLELVGEPVVDVDGRMTVQALVAPGECQIGGRGVLRIVRMRHPTTWANESDSAEPIAIDAWRHDGELDLVDPSPGTSVSHPGRVRLGRGMRHSHRSLSVGGDRGPLRDLRINASVVTVHSHVDGLELHRRGPVADDFHGFGWLPRLEVAQSAWVQRLCGRLVLRRVEKGGVVQGDPRRAPTLHRVGKVTGAQLDHVNLCHLPFADLGRLAEAHRVIPAMPRRIPKRLERPVSLGAAAHPPLRPRHEPPVARWDAARFYEKLYSTASELGAPGSVLRDLGYAEARARRRAVPWGAEKLLLSLYSLVGYGRRIARPMLFYPVVAFLGTLLHHHYESVKIVMDGEFFGSWARLALTPFILLRVLPDSVRLSAATPPGVVVVGFVAAIEVAFLGWAVLAAKRLRERGKT